VRSVTIIFTTPELLTVTAIHTGWSRGIGRRQHFNGHSTMFMVNGVSGSVYAYNYGVNLQQKLGLYGSRAVDSRRYAQHESV